MPIYQVSLWPSVACRRPDSSQNLCSFVVEAAGTQDPKLQCRLNQYFDSMSAENDVDVVVQSPNYLKILVESASKLGIVNDPRFRVALYADEEQIATQLTSILDSEVDSAIVLNLRSAEAQYFLDAIQTILDKGFLIRHDQSAQAHKMIQQLSAISDEFPPSLFLSNIMRHDERPTFGGPFFNVYKATYHRKTVALKVMRIFLRGSDLHRFRLLFCQQALIWQHLCHRNVLCFIGIDRESFAPSIGMVSPWMEHGNVLQYLNEHGRGNVNNIVGLLDIANGLQYIHSSGIVHGDLRGANVLIDDEPKACIADFGLTQLSDFSLKHGGERAGSLHWMAPELIDPDSFGVQPLPSFASDVYAFGCVCVELYTGQPPFTNISDVKVISMIMAGRHPEWPFSTNPIMTNALWQLVIECRGRDYAARPAIEDIVQRLS
ncbi:kinase-like domain-containing protein, partial [Mycena maculata]